MSEDEWIDLYAARTSWEILASIREFGPSAEAIARIIQRRYGEVRAPKAREDIKDR